MPNHDGLGDFNCGTAIGGGDPKNNIEATVALKDRAAGVGYSCLAEQRVVERLLEGEIVTPFLKPGDRMRIEMLDARGHSIFGAIEQQVTSNGR